MLTVPRLAASCLGLALAVWSCTPCETTLTPAPLQNVCHRADAGAIEPNAPFVLEGTNGSRTGTCRVVVDGGQIDLFADLSTFCEAPFGGAAAPREPPGPIRCTIPALPVGTYSVNSVPGLTFTIPDAGVASCP